MPGCACCKDEVIIMLKNAVPLTGGLQDSIIKKEVRLN
jgi:hypothetical protein